METNSLFYRFLAAIAVVLMFIFISCASTDTVEDGTDLEDEITLAEGEIDDEEDGEAEEIDEEELIEDEEDGEDSEDEGDEEEEEEELAEVDDEDDLDEDEEELAALEEEDEEFEDGEDAEALEDELAALEGEDGDDGEEGEDELAALEDGGEDMGDTELDGEQIAQAGDLDEPLPDEDFSDADTDTTDTFSDTSEEPSPSLDVGSFGASSQSYPKSVAPSIATQAVDKDGINLNRFYFVRSGDSADAIATLIYGDPNKSADLIEWNSGRSGWSPGSVIYYSSPADPSDTSMQSFYQARDVAPDGYSVRRGESLSAIAMARYNSWKSWKEIAVVNGFDSPDDLSAGAELNLYPADLSPYAYDEVFSQDPPQQLADQVQPPPAIEPPALAQNTPPPTPPSQQAAPPLPPSNVVPPPPPVVTPPPAAAPPAPQPIVQTPKKKKGGLAKILEQNMFVMAIFGVVFLLLLGMIVINKKRKAAQDDFADDNFSARPKAKRK